MKLCRVRQTRQLVPKPRTVSVVVAVILVIAGTGVPSHYGRAEEPPYQYYALKRPHPQPAPGFVLKDQDGKSRALSSLRGKIVLITFGFTNCPNICPTILANLARAYDLLSAEEQARVQVLFISVDPSRDTSKVLKTYVPFFNRHFIGLTGQPEQIAAVAKAYGVEYETISQSGAANASSYNIEHSDTVYVISSSGKWIGFYGNRQLQNSQRIAADLHHFLSLSEGNSDDWQSEGAKLVKAQAPSGRQLYLAQCASCHLEDGRGIPGKYPPLVGSSWVNGAPNRLTTLVVNGVEPTPDATRPSLGGIMPAWRTIMTPTDTAAVLSYIRQAWGNTASGISAGYVQNLTYQFIGRTGLWSWKELEALPPDTDANAATVDAPPAQPSR
jgi:protein SCO1/2